MTPSDKDGVSINYVGDLTADPPAGALLVAQDADYVRACAALARRAESATMALKVWVRSMHHFAWLRDFTTQIGCPADFAETTPRLLLAEQWNVILPDWLTDADILKNNLLAIKVAAQKTRPFDVRLLAHYLGKSFEREALTAADLVPVLTALVSEDAKAPFKAQPLLGRCLEAVCERWAAGSSEAWIRGVCQELSEDPSQFWRWLSLWSGLNSYPDKLLEYVLPPDQAAFVRKVPAAALRDLPLAPVAREQIVTQIELFLNDVRPQVASSADFLKVVACTSGQFLREYQLLAGMLKSNQFAPSKADIEAVRARFQSCPGVSESQLNALSYCVKPGRPTLLETGQEWGITEWARWTTEEYLPYRTWQVHSGQYDDDLEKTVARFSDWYVREYASVQKEPEVSLVHCLTGISSSGAEDEFAIVLLIDGLPLSFMEMLDQALRNVGLHRHELSYRFAALPTSTAYNKAALLAGNGQEKTDDYEALLKARAASDWGGKNVQYLPTLKKLSEMTAPQGAAIAVLNYLDGDELLHSDVESKNTTFEDELHRLFARVAESVSRLAQEWAGSKERFRVYVVTDHGACRILKEEERSFDSATVKKLFPSEKHRFAAVPEEKAAEIPQNLWALGHRFQPPFAADSTVFFLPRGHNTVRGASGGKGFMHGGVTPEEVIVPVARYKLVKVAWKSLGARFVGLDLDRGTGRAKFYVQRVVTLDLELQNPNPTEARVLRATVVSPEAEVKSCEAPTIPAAGAKSLNMSCYFQKAALGQKPLEIEIAYEVAGEQHTLQIVIECEFKSAMAGGFSLKDL